MTACIQRSLAIGSRRWYAKRADPGLALRDRAARPAPRAALHRDLPLIESPGHVGIGDSDGAGDQARNEVHT